MANQSYKRQNSHQLSLWRRMAASQIEDQNEQQQQQPANHSSDNAEIARCLTLFSHPGLRIEHLSDIIPKAQSWLVLNLPVFMFVYIHFNVPGPE